jgi:hypothetical protein
VEYVLLKEKLQRIQARADDYNEQRTRVLLTKQQLDNQEVRGHTQPLQPAHEHLPPPRTQPPRAVSHPADARRRALGGASHVAHHSQRKILSLSPGLHHKRSSSLCD